MDRATYWRNRTVLVTGATGFLGGWLVRRLRQLGSRVVTIVRRPRAESQFAASGFAREAVVYTGCVSDPALIRRLFQEHEIDVAFHTAALSDVNEVLADPAACFRSCVQSTWLLLESVRTGRPQCVCVVSSSDKAYGRQEMPLRETQRLDPIHPYDTAKASQDLAAQSYGKMYDLPVAVTRCGNYFGGYDFSYSRLIPGTIRSILQGAAPVLRSDGRFTRDFLYIEDAVDTQLLLAERLAEDATIRGEAFNFSYGLEMEVIDVVRTILDRMGSELTPIVANDVVAETKRLTLSSEKARRQLGWCPEIGFDTGLQQTIDWYVEHLASGGRHRELVRAGSRSAATPPASDRTPPA